MAKLTNEQLVELYRDLEQQVIELAAKVERLSLDLSILTARVTVRPPGPKKEGAE